MTALRIVLGALFGGGLAFGATYAVLSAAGWSGAPWTALVVGLLGLVYGSLANAMAAYENLASWVGFVLDVTWSMINTTAALLVWLPACAAAGKRISPTRDTVGTGCIVYDKNPRGGNYAATTIGPVIGGGWDSHEALHVWQARLFGPLYMPTYGLSWLLNLLGRLLVLKTANIAEEAYRRIVWEDWAYLGGTSTAKINWGGWIGGFFLTLLYLGLLALIPIGIAVGSWWVWGGGAAGLLLYTIIRAAIG